VEGDYSNRPPEGKYDQRHRRSRKLLKGPPVWLNVSQRRAAVEAIVGKLAELGVQVLAASVDGCHYHVLARFRGLAVREAVGRAKKNASYALREHGLPGAVWAKRCRPLPITDRRHQVDVFGYIVSHVERGACVWTFRKGIVLAGV
jgi:hypothetical protein